MSRLSAWWLGLPEQEAHHFELAFRMVMAWPEFQNESPRFQFDPPEIPSAFIAPESLQDPNPPPPEEPFIRFWEDPTDRSRLLNDYPDITSLYDLPINENWLFPADQPYPDLVRRSLAGEPERQYFPTDYQPPVVDEYVWSRDGAGQHGQTAPPSVEGPAVVLMHDGLTFVV